AKAGAQRVWGENMGDMVARMLGVEADNLDPEQDVQREYGVETIHLTRLAEMLRAEIGADVDVKELLERDSIRSMAACLQEHHAPSARAETAGSAELDLFDLAYTLQVGREAMEEGRGFGVPPLEELAEKLQGFLGAPPPRERAGGEGLRPAPTQSRQGPRGSREKAPHPNPLPEGRAKTPSADTVAEEGKE